MSLQKTPLQDYIDYIQKEFGFVTSDNIKETFLEKEKKQIIDACNQLEFEDENCFGICETITKGEQYYNETFKK